MFYVYIVVLGIFMLLFAISRTENVSVYMNKEDKKSFPGGILFLRAALWCMKQKERLIEKSAGNGMRNKELLYRGRLEKNLKLLNPSLPEKQQAKELCVRQYSIMLLVLFVGNLLSLCMALSSRTDRLLQEGHYINRKGYGQGDIEIALLAEVEGRETESILYTVDEQKYTDEEIGLLYQEAVAHLPEIILGENKNMAEITEDLNLVTAIEGYPFKIEWESSSYSLIHTDGTVNNKELEKAEIVTLQ
ncbi:MAG: hypothetical protein K2H31_10345, partial [Lachnospiraceae bacterium]|nr:hypothetical protein [Lachnospiraceae bacterium]